MIESISINYVVEPKLVDNVVPSFCGWVVLISTDDTKFTVFFDDLSDIINEPIERINLLPD